MRETARKPVFLVTGGSRGIGVRRISEAGGEAHAVQADTGKVADIERLFAVVDRLGHMFLVSGIAAVRAEFRTASATTFTSRCRQQVVMNSGRGRVRMAPPDRWLQGTGLAWICS